MKLVLAMMTTLALTACVSGARYQGAPSAAPQASAPDPFARASRPTAPVFSADAEAGKPGQE